MRPRPRKPEPPEPATRSLVASARRLYRLLTGVLAGRAADINKTVSWGTDCVHPGGEPSKITCASHTNSLSSLAGKEVAVKVAMADAELYSISLGCA